MPGLLPGLLVVVAYLLGATPTSWWVGRAVYGVDLREKGSGNLGATNTFRVLGWRAALPVALFDVFKGWLPAAAFAAWAGVADPIGWSLAFGGAAILGHVFSLWVRFRGGKGVATSAGVFLALAPWATLACLVAFVAVFRLTRMVSAGSITAALVLTPAVALTPTRGGAGLIAFSGGLALFVIWAHRSNIGRILRGEESRFGGGRTSTEPSARKPPAPERTRSTEGTS
jgi:glycerol-3-phosphate acyltransferase PlsY